MNAYALLVAPTLLLAACAGGSAPADRDPAAPAGDASVSLTVVGEDTSFDREQLTGPAGEQVTVTFDNRDEGVTHNFHVVAGDEGDFKTDIAAGPVMQTLEFSIATAGEYTYVCDVTPPR